MKFTINTKDLLKKLQMVGSLIKSPNQMPILDNVLMVINEGVLKLEATDLEIRSVVEMPVTAEGAYSVCVPYQLLLSTLKGFPNAPVELEFTDKILIVRSDESNIANGKYEIPVNKAEEFPPNKFELSGEKVTFSSLEFVEAIRKAAVYIDEKAMNGMANLLVWVKDDSTKVVGGNFGLIYEYTLASKGPEKKLLLSKSVVQYLAQTITDEEDLEVSYTDNHVFFSMVGRQVAAILGNLAFPAYEGLFAAKSTDKKYKVDADTLLPALKRICNLTDKNSFGVDFRFTVDTLEMTFDHIMQKCNAKETIKVDYEGEPFFLGLNATQLSTCLNSLEGPITLEMSMINKPCFITADNVRVLTMPMKPAES